jgi:hypothetical protein
MCSAVVRVVAFWSDGTSKSRWVAIPSEEIKFSATGEWIFPAGTVFVKNFELPTSVTEDIPIKTATGEVRHQTWYYPSRKDGCTRSISAQEV